MTLLDVITAAAASAATANPDNAEKTSEKQHDYPTVLDSETGLRSLHKSVKEPPNPNHLVFPVSGFTLSESDRRMAKRSTRFVSGLSKYLTETKKLKRDVFEEKVCNFLIEVSQINQCVDQLDGASDGLVLIERFGNLIGQDAAGLLVEGCVKLEMLDWIKALILNKVVRSFTYSGLIEFLIQKKMSDLICEFVKNSSDLKAGDILSILRYFLVPSKEACLSMVEIRKVWEHQALKAVERVVDPMLIEFNRDLAKKSSVLLMVAYDGFSDPELCLHYLFAVVSVDELVWTSAISKLNGKEMMALIRYLGKWLKKYGRFPEAVPCPKASLPLGLKAVNWVPNIEDIINCLGLVIDEHFSTLVLHEEFHDEIRSLDGLVGSLVLDARLCCYLHNVTEVLKSGESIREKPSPFQVMDVEEMM